MVSVFPITQAIRRLVGLEAQSNADRGDWIEKRGGGEGDAILVSRPDADCVVMCREYRASIYSKKVVDVFRSHPVGSVREWCEENGIEITFHGERDAIISLPTSREQVLFKMRWF